MWSKYSVIFIFVSIFSFSISVLAEETTLKEKVPDRKAFANSVGMNFVYIPSNTFVMGSPPDEPSRNGGETQHPVTLSRGFYIQTTEVTQAQWKAVQGSNPAHFRDCGGNCPVENVSWVDVQGFIDRLNQHEGTNGYRLPTEAEWEYACRAGTNTPFSTGICLSDQANYNGNYPWPGCKEKRYRYLKKTIPASKSLPNAWGLYDMHGNVWEWCQDWYGEYPSGHVNDPTGSSSGSFKVCRGGSWYCVPQSCRSASRNRNDPKTRYSTHGFRLIYQAQSLP